MRPPQARTATNHQSACGDPLKPLAEHRECSARWCNFSFFLVVSRSGIPLVFAHVDAPARRKLGSARAPPCFHFFFCYSHSCGSHPLALRAGSVCGGCVPSSPLFACVCVLLQRCRSPTSSRSVSCSPGHCGATRLPPSPALTLRNCALFPLLRVKSLISPQADQ